MKTLADYVRGVSFVPIVLVLDYKENGKKLYLCKEEYRMDFYFMDGEEVCYAIQYPNDRTCQLAIDILNNKNVEQAKKELEEQPAYKRWQKFIKERLEIV